MTRSNVIRAAALLAITSASCALAADLPKEGSFDVTGCFTRVSNLIEYSKTHSATSFEQTGTSLSNPPGGLFDYESVRCVGMTSAFGGKNTLMSVCEAIDRDGDRRLTTFSLGSDGKVVREAVTGTGKYDGLETTSTYKVLGPFPVIKAGTSQFCNRQVGTYKMK